MNKVYLYDNYYGLINLIFELLKNNIKPDDIRSLDYEPSLLDEVIHLEVSNYFNVFKKFDERIIKAFYFTFLSNRNDKEILLYHFLKAGVKYRENVFRYRNIEEVNEVIKISKYVGAEAHKLKGFLRFKKIKNFYYASFESTNNVLPILVHHFKTRLGCEYWIIKDDKRNIYAVYDLKSVKYIKNSDLKIDLNESSEFEDLWKVFFKTIAIKERKNLKCQMNFMPKKYWSHMLEMEDYK